MTAHPCLQCDSLVRYLVEDLLQKVPVQDQSDVNDAINTAFETFKDISSRYQGVIDPTTLYRASAEFHSDFNKFLSSSQFMDLPGISTLQMMQEGERTLTKYLDSFVKTGLCPNRCGIFNQTLINCATCKYEFRRCETPPERRPCGVVPLEAEEGSQVVLDCFLPWHSLVAEQKEYHFSRSSNLSGEFHVFLVTPQSKVILNQLELDEGGLYECILRDGSGTVLAQLRFNLTVKAEPLSTFLPVPAIPTLTGQDPPSLVYRDLFVAAVAAVATLSLLGSFAVAFSFGKALKQQQEREERWRRREEM